MTENMRKWLELVSLDDGLRKRIRELGDAEPEHSVSGIIGLAATYGIALEPEDLLPGMELDDGELDAVAGGLDPLYRQYCSCGCMTTGFGEEGPCGF